jgi:hypothetical protein
MALDGTLAANPVPRSVPFKVFCVCVFSLFRFNLSFGSGQVLSFHFLSESFSQRLVQVVGIRWSAARSGKHVRKKRLITSVYCDIWYIIYCVYLTSFSFPCNGRRQNCLWSREFHLHLCASKMHLKQLPDAARLQDRFSLGTVSLSTFNPTSPTSLEFFWDMRSH